MTTIAERADSDGDVASVRHGARDEGKGADAPSPMTALVLSQGEARHVGDKRCD